MKSKEKLIFMFGVWLGYMVSWGFWEFLSRGIK